MVLYFLCKFRAFWLGILVGYLFKTDKLQLRVLNKACGLLIGFAIANIGKIFFYSSFVKSMGNYGFIFESIGPLVMTFGFAWMILVSLRNEIVFKLIGNKVFVFLGRISYSFYLWHFIVLWYLYAYTINIFPQNALGVVYLFTAMVVVLIPISFLSYKLLEEFYFKKVSTK
ncbi:MAG TPA: acyltransferase family protein [Ferruginibacter sp.]|nr:acyltransferase family protein [Ferruginibacter sp.]